MTTDEDFVRDFHRRFPGATATALARGRIVGDDRSTYDRLAAAIAPGGRVLDLGCGDGYLIERLIAHGHGPAQLLGLDVSDAELAAARRRVPAVALVHARAQALPIATGALTAVVSHLAFTLMPELDAIVDELARVLAPGGVVATVVGGGPRGDDAFAGLLELGRGYAALAPPTPRLGDPRGRTDAGLAALFAPRRGFAALTIIDLDVDLSGSPSEVWASLAPSYHLATLTVAARAELEREFVAAAPQWRRADGAIAATMYVRLVVATRSQPAANDPGATRDRLG